MDGIDNQKDVPRPQIDHGGDVQFVRETTLVPFGSIVQLE